MFCEDPLWNANLTWYTDNPDFTTCFHQTVLVYVPLAILLLFLPVELYYARKSKDRHIPFTVLNGTKIILNLILISLPLVDLFYVINQDAAWVHLVASIARAITFIVTLGLLLICLRRGLVTSGVLFYFWTLLVIADGLTFRSAIMSGYAKGPDSMPPFVTALIQYPIVVAMFFLNCWADARPKHINLDGKATIPLANHPIINCHTPSFADQLENITPERYASHISRMLFGWVDPLTWKGWKTTLDKSELWALKDTNRCSGVIPAWNSCWSKQVKNSKGHDVSILPTLFKAFGPAYFFSSILMLGVSVLQFASPQIVDLLIAFVSSDDPNWKGYLYTFLIVAITFSVSVLNSQSFYQEYLVGLRVRTALISAIYRKSLKLSNTARKEMTVGETTNLMQIDTQKFMDITLYFNLIWSSPLQIALALYFLWGTLGPSALAGLGVMILFLPLNVIITSKMKKLQVSQMRSKDRRTKLMDEILNGIKILKLYAWETSFQDKVLQLREDEVQALKVMAYWNAGMTFLWTCAPVMIALASFGAFVLSDSNNILDANTAFVSLTLFNLLRVPMNLLPTLMVYLVQCQVSLKRVNKFMNSEELDPNTVTHNNQVKDAIHIDNASFRWDKNQEPTIKNISLRVKEGSLVALVGQVGAGKSSLISAMLGEMDRTQGSINTKGQISYVPQQAWIQNGTVQYNITFGNRFKESTYKRVIDSCALRTDLDMLPGGDQTEIGEKGINLSGGQKQRVSMARATYNGGKLFFLDDPLSAVDSHVGAHMFKHVIGPEGILKNKTRILATHSAKYLPQCDNIVVMKNGEITEMGTYKELLRDDGEFAEFLIQYLTEEQDKEAEEDGANDTLENLKQELEVVMGKDKVQRQLSYAKSQKSESCSSVQTSRTKSGQRNRRNRKDSILTDLESIQESTIIKPGTQLIEDEKSAVGGVKWSVYQYYGRSVGNLMLFASLILYGSYQGFSVGSSIWLSRWSIDPLASTDTSVRNMYLGVYGVLGLFQAVFIMAGTVFISIACLNAAITMHATMLQRILRSPMSFFDTTPLGRILNRFSKDIDIIDITIPQILRSLLVQILTVVGTIFIICFANPIFIAIIIPVFIIYYFVQKFYVATARQVKRLESITRSPIYSHFGETISGAPTIRAYGVTEKFIGENEAKIDINQECYYPTFVSSRWLSIRLECIGNLIILFAALFTVLSRDKLDPGLVGLTLSYALTITNSMSFLVSMTSEIETNMVGVERVREYQEIPTEAALEMPEQDPPPGWPKYGVVRFADYQTRYRKGLDLVLKGIDCHIQSGEKIGIVGRTGAGKSSLTLGLFRIIESAGGAIIIDDQDIGLMGLHRLRSRLTIIPQDPVLFSGSLRMNLDPFNKYSDQDLWTALDHAHLKAYVSNLPKALHFEVNEGGENLSVGQRQLVCLARALLRKTKVLILDEATAAVDLETDDLIQATIRTEFSDCTVLTIAHRLNTIMDSSKVIVLDAGKVIEFDTPGKLLKNKQSVFYGMVNEAGLAPKDDIGDLMQLDSFIEEDGEESSESDPKPITPPTLGTSPNGKEREGDAEDKDGASGGSV
eukprot:maker-scaffold313_size211302-snap-gene-0.9 protein:Tk07287 transcript:maker-scaffold313_size211302-snap-gene-0.9-mRNA-1 annotation:"multidrug resistance-associated protein 1 isoform x4"